MGDDPVQEHPTESGDAVAVEANGPGRPLPDAVAPTAGQPARMRRLGSRYLLRERIGRGAMGEVWRGAIVDTGEAVAVKLLRDEFTQDPEVLSRFVRERTVLLRISHPRLVAVRDLVVEGDDLAIVMDLVEGGDLRRHLATHRTLPAAEAVDLTVQILEGLAASARHVSVGLGAPRQDLIPLELGGDVANVNLWPKPLVRTRLPPERSACESDARPRLQGATRSARSAA